MAGRERRVAHSFRKGLVRLDGWLERQGVARSTLVMTIAAITAMMIAHVILKTLEGQPITLTSIINLPLESGVVAAPLILYSRRRRAELAVLTRKLADTANEAREASRAKSAFLANMSHELRTPLNAILGFSEIMMGEHLGPMLNARYLSYCTDIHSSGRHLLGIINDVLDLAKIEAGKMSLDGEAEFALVPTLSGSLAMLAGLGEKHGVSLVSHWEDETVRVMAVERMLRQIVINLVGNAIKFTPSGGHVVVSGKRAPDGAYCLHVRDTGIGMNKSEMANALVPFGQNRARLSVHQEGTGLGLPLAKAMIELHGGSLKLDSEPNHGTWVTLRLPADRVRRSSEKAAA